MLDVDFIGRYFDIVPTTLSYIRRQSERFWNNFIKQKPEPFFTLCAALKKEERGKMVEVRNKCGSHVFM